MIEQFLIFLPLVIGAYITFSLLKLPDFSIESAYLFGAVIAYVCKDFGVLLVVLGAVCGGGLVGLVVSFLNQQFKLPFILAAIITNGIFHGTTQYLLGTSQKSFHLASFVSEYKLFLIVGVILILLLSFLIRSELGYALAIYGNNPRFFESHSISSKYVLFSGVILGHGFAGLSGFLFSLSNGFVDLTMNYGIILLTLTALILGKSLLQRRTLFIPLAGLSSYICLQQILLKMGLNLKYFNLFQALLILAVLLTMQKKKQVSFDHLGV